MNILLEESLTIAYLLITLFISAFFSGSETALFSLSDDNSQKIKKTGFGAGELVKTLERNPAGILSTILFGNLIINIIFFCISSSLIYRIDFVYKKSNGIFIGLLTLFLIIIFGEVIPKAIGLKYSDRIVHITAPIIHFFYKIFKPVRIILDKLIKRISRNTNSNFKFSNEELKILVDSTKPSDDFGLQEKEIIEEIINMSILRIRELMTPRVKLDYFNENWTVEKCLKMIKKSNFELLPVYSDYEENLIGCIEFSDLLKNDNTIKINTFVKPIKYVPENKTADSMLNEFLNENLMLAAVVDEFGGLSGVISKNDLLKKIISFSNTNEKLMIKSINKDTYLLNGHLNIREWKELFIGFFPKEYLNSLDLDTLGGLVTSILKKIPKEGEKAYLGNLCFTIDKMNNHSIDMINLKLLNNEDYRDE